VAKNRNDCRTVAAKRAFLAAYRRCGIIQEAATASKVGRRTVFDWLKNDPQFLKDYEEAQDQAIELLEAEADRRGKEGVRKPVLYKGEQVQIKDPQTGKMEPLWEHVYSDLLLIFRLKALRPQKYRDGFQGGDGGPATIVRVRPLGAGGVRRCSPRMRAGRPRSWTT
jgi:hypothetical protein